MKNKKNHPVWLNTMFRLNPWCEDCTGDECSSCELRQNFRELYKPSRFRRKQ